MNGVREGKNLNEKKSGFSAIPNARFLRMRDPYPIPAVDGHHSQPEIPRGNMDPSLRFGISEKPMVQFSDWSDQRLLKTFTTLLTSFS
jgi:hypothetical protein